MTVKKNKYGHWEYSFMYKGKRYHRSFKNSSQDEVQQFEIVHKSELIKNGYDITKKKTYYLSDLIENAKTYFNAHYTRPTERDYVLDRFYKLVGNKVVEQITVSDIEKYINSRIGKVKNSTINRDLDIIRRVFSLAMENELITVNPCKKLKKLRIENPPERYLAKDEEIKLLENCNSIMRAIVITALYTGMRQNEILSLKWQDVFFEENYIIALNTKNNKPRKIPLVLKLKEELLKLARISEYVFTSPATLSKYTNIKKTFSRTVKRSGIPHITFHQLRHTTASRLNELGVDIVTIQRVLDHADLKTTMRYTHNSNNSISRAFDLLNEY